MSLFTFLLRRRHHHHRLRHHYTTATTTTNTSSLQTPLSHPTYFIWSSNTSLGKTLVSTGLAISSLLSPTPSDFHYFKPVQTGFPSDSDSLFVFNKLHSFSLLHKPYAPILSSHHVLYSSPSAASAAHPLSGSRSSGTNDSGMEELASVERRRIEGERSELVSELVCKTVFAWKEAVSPHLAAERESGVVRDGVVVEMVEKCLREAVEGDEGGDRKVLSVVETAGGVASPGPSGSLQCDLYRYLI